MTKLTNCRECGKKRTIPKKTYASRHAYETDDFCSRPCCEKAHGITHLKGHTARNYSAWYAA